MSSLYLDCNSGISGDMFVASLIGLGADTSRLLKAIDSLKGHHVEGFEAVIGTRVRSGIVCTDFDVILDKEHDGHDHDMEYLHGHDHEHSHEHTHEHGGHTHSHDHRGLHDIIHIIDHADMSSSAKDTAKKIFDIIAEAESKAHGISMDEVHFHEVGAVDSIVDIISAAVLIDDLDPDEVIITDLSEGRGTVRCAHGLLSIPVPAVANIVADNGIALRNTNIEGELVTPTGAAIAAVIRTTDKLPTKYKIIKTGLGAGKRDYEAPGFLRAMLIEPDESEQDKILRLETDIDDCSSEDLGFVAERLFEAGAREVHFSPIYMKKSRPGSELVVICDISDKEKLEKIIFGNTTTIGIREIICERTILKRFSEVVEFSLGKVDVKTVILPDGRVVKHPEYESLRSIALSNDLPIQEVRNILAKETQII
ncbi:MAG: nickel pincer cofactor biosynthesis protein LarC [Clostridiales bacterium]|nr:nickel pincer cofactor biosynthesis protein LarC [Clostridiales bacterium]